MSFDYGDPQQRSQTTLSLTTGGITLLSVVLSIGVTVAFGIEAPVWARLLAGVGTVVVLTTAIKLGSSAGHGPLARLSSWVIGAPGSTGTD